MHAKVHVFLKPHDQRDEEEAGHYGSVEDAGLMYSHGYRNHSPQSGEGTCPSSWVLGRTLNTHLTFVRMW